MSRTLRRLVAGALVAASVTAFAPPAQAQKYIHCYEFTLANGYFHGCI